MDATVLSAAQRLSEALSAVRSSLLPLFEYADDLESRDHDDVELMCIAALLRVRAQTARSDVVTSLAALEEAARSVAAA